MCGLNSFSRRSKYLSVVKYLVVLCCVVLKGCLRVLVGAGAGAGAGAWPSPALVWLFAE